MLGFFDESTVGQDHRPALSSANHDSFNCCVSRVFGDVPNGSDGSDLAVFRDENGILTIFNWLLVGRNDIADAVVLLQRQTGCEVTQRVRWHSSFVRPDHLPQHFQYYTVEFKKVRDHWQKFYEDLAAMRDETECSGE